MVPLLAGCGSDAARAEDDAGADAGDAGSGLTPTAPAPPELPRATPCPDGWRAVADEGSPDVVTCDPWPESGRDEGCAADEAHFPGTPGCARIGTECPAAAQWAPDIPAAETVVYVRSGEPAGGDGSPARPFPTIAQGVAAAPDRAIVALTEGTYDEILDIRRPLTLWGACTARTTIASSVPHATAATLTFASRAGATLRNLRVSGARRGVAVAANDPAVTFESVVVDGATELAVVVQQEGSLVAHDLVVRDTAPAGSFGFGLTVIVGRAELDRAVFERNSSAALYVSDVGSELVASDLVVQGTLPHESDGFAGEGLDLFLGATADLSRAVFSGNRNAGLNVSDSGTVLTATDLVVTDTRSEESTRENGYGLALLHEASAEIRRATFERNRTVEILANEGSSLVATDLVVRDTQSRESDGVTGYGLDLWGYATGEIERAAFLRTRGGAVVMAEGELTLSDLVIRDVRSQEGNGRFGDGIAIQDGAVVTVRRAALERCRRTGLAAHGAGTSLTGEDVAVDDTLEQECADAGCEDGPGGTALGAVGGAAVLTRFRLSGNALCGVQIAADGAVDLHDGEVARNRIGANVQVEGFDASRLQDGVRYVDNERTFDGSELPVPQAVQGVIE